VLASDIPDKVDTPTVSIGTSDTSVTVSWNEPGYHSSAITAYEILFLKSDNSFAADSNCDGS
jgi:hypothetical protein